MATLYSPEDDPEWGESLMDWSSRVTLIVSYDPDSDTIVIDRGKAPKVMVEGILARLDEDEFSFADQLEDVEPWEVETDDG